MVSQANSFFVSSRVASIVFFPFLLLLGSQIFRRLHLLLHLHDLLKSAIHRFIDLEQDQEFPARTVVLGRLGGIPGPGRKFEVNARERMSRVIFMGFRGSGRDKPGWSERPARDFIEAP